MVDVESLVSSEDLFFFSFLFKVSDLLVFICLVVYSAVFSYLLLQERIKTVLPGKT